MEHTIKKILVPVDFNEPSAQAVNYAGALARKVNAEILLLNVIYTPGLLAQFFSDSENLVKITGQAKEKLIELAGALKNKIPEIVVGTRVESGKPYEKILSLSEEWGANMVILGENHQCGNPEDELGTTVYHVTLKSKVPVLTLKGDISRMKDHIVVPLDLTKKTSEQLSAALYYGLEYNAVIHLVSVLAGGIEKKESRIYKKLKEAKDVLEQKGVKCKMKLYKRSEIPPFKRVLEYAENVDAGMILLMTHQEGYTYDNYIGAFAHHIMNLSKVSILSITSVSNNLDFAPFFKALVDPIGVIIKK
ncbi:universal stress protein [Mariniphaga sp.]|uniref:universal stress protein n=1 Tax=Mariniphaga sp. TaxID=1954475 RepID=UPI00356B2EBD